MATNLISTGDTAATSSEVTLADGASANWALKSAAQGAEVVIELEDNAGSFHGIGRLVSTDPAKNIVGPGTYRARRIAGASCGVFSA